LLGPTLHAKGVQKNQPTEKTENKLIEKTKPIKKPNKPIKK
jgi:hypothetical protein